MESLIQGLLATKIKVEMYAIEGRGRSALCHHIPYSLFQWIPSSNVELPRRGGQFRLNDLRGVLWILDCTLAFCVANLPNTRQPITADGFLDPTALCVAKIMSVLLLLQAHGYYATKWGQRLTAFFLAHFLTSKEGGHTLLGGLLLGGLFFFGRLLGSTLAVLLSLLACARQSIAAF